MTRPVLFPWERGGDSSLNHLKHVGCSATSWLLKIQVTSFVVVWLETEEETETDTERETDGGTESYRDRRRDRDTEIDAETERYRDRCRAREIQS